MTWRVSPSQVETWILCRRKHLWRYVAGLEAPTSSSAQLGIDAHAILEGHLRGDLGPVRLSVPFERLRKAWKVVAPALDHFPRPGACRTEEKWDLDWGGVSWAGRYDALDAAGTVYDLKTRSDPRWCSTETDLRTDVQAILYAKATGATRGRWVYAITKGAPRAWPVDFAPVLEGPVADLLHQRGREISDHVARAVHPLSIAPPDDLRACRAYGGCPFRAHCVDLDPLRQVFATGDPEMNNEDLLAKFRQSTAAQPAQEAINPPEAAEAGPPPLPPPSKEEAPGAGAKRSRRGAKKATQEDSPAEPPPPAAPVAQDRDMGSAPLDRHLLEALFVDCAPNHDVPDAAKLIDTAHALVRADLKVDDYRLIEYGAGAGALRAAFARVLDVDKPKELFLDSDSPEGKIVLVECLARAHLITRRK